uniref:Uncharacterized protein n=1 Tax=Rhizophora mucronata TaxID=61149 RepID=A0A2P2PUS4_RHIMU
MMQNHKQNNQKYKNKNEKSSCMFENSPNLELFAPYFKLKSLCYSPNPNTEGVSCIRTSF